MHKQIEQVQFGLNSLEMTFIRHLLKCNDLSEETSKSTTENDFCEKY